MSGPVQALFDDIAVMYDQIPPLIFRQLGVALVARADLCPDELVLDLATGRGAVLLPAAALARQVIGIDISAKMVELVNREIKARGLQNARVKLMDANQLSFPPGSFHVVLCGSALYLFPDPASVLDAARHVLTPGGRLLVSTWSSAVDPRWRWLADLVDDLSPYRLPPEPYATLEGLEEFLHRGGFDDVDAYSITIDATFRDADHWLEWSLSNGFRGFLNRVARIHRHDFKRRVQDGIEAALENDGLLHRQLRALIGKGTSPGR